MDDALDHRVVVLRIGKNHAFGQQAAQRRQRRQVGDPAGTEQQRRLPAVQIGQLALQQHVVVIGAGDVAGAAGTRAAPRDGLVHRRQYRGMLPHPEIVVRAPHRDLADFARAMAQCPRKTARLTLQVGEHAVTALPLQGAEPLGEKVFVVHASPFPPLLRNCSSMHCRLFFYALPPVPSQTRASSSARSTRASISSMSSAPMISGGDKAMMSPTITRTIRPCSSQRRPTYAPTPRAAGNGDFVVLFSTSSRAPTSPTPRASPTSGCCASRRKPACSTGATRRT